MGEVYKARDARLDRDVAVKVLLPEVSSDPDRLRRFEREARAAAALNHPNILSVFDVGTHDGTVYVVTELLTVKHSARGSTPAALPSTRQWPKRSRSPMVSLPRMSGGSFIEISNRQTYS